MYLFERSNALKLNFKRKDVDEKADIEVRMGEDGKPIIDAGSGAIGGGLPEGGNAGDVIVRKNVEGGLLGHKPNIASNTIRKVYVNLDALRNAPREYDPGITLYSVSVMQPPEEGNEALVWVGVDTEGEDDYGNAMFFNVQTWHVEQPSDFPTVIVNMTDDALEYSIGFVAEPHTAYLVSYPDEGGVVAQMLTGNEYVFQINEYYGNVVEGVDGSGTGDFSVVNKFISFDAPFTEDDSAEWKPLPIVRCEFTESADVPNAFECSMTYDDIIDAYVNNKQIVVGSLDRSNSGVSKRITVIASSFIEGDYDGDFKMSPLLPTPSFKYLRYSDTDDGLWYIMFEIF